ncbi:unnamed protein product [Acanthoscelides obtectus]|uniref:Ataxin-10 domain-containing protein n=1 Tax=Acanthoscelides obtectus TaxID=200917 RepID=A0A9P0NQE5_ACAOB|nr:unnamed protein product [Acanthoscelides obtectus]CAK1678472.1 Ataxin-10 [Acanthoscelides obtectus]
MSSEEKILVSSINGSEKSISLDIEIQKEIEQLEWKDHFLPNVKEVFKIERLTTGEPLRIIASNEAISLINRWIKFLMEKTGSESRTDETLNTLLELLRCLRNCTSNLQTQDYINEKTNILDHTVKLFEIVFKVNKDHLLLKVILQFLNNFISSNEKTSRTVYNLFFNLAKSCLKENINIYETSALIYNISLFIPIQDLDIFHSILSIFKNENYDEMDHYEFLHFFLEKSIGTKEFWTIYTDFPLNDKTTMLDYFKHLLIQKRNLTIHDEGLRTLVNTILTSSDIIFQTRECSESDQELINEISLTLEILSSLSSDENYLKKLQTNKDLFINAGVLLINVHRLGKEPNSCFTPLQKLSELGKPTEGLKNHPAFGFKADLIRLIGNMCWKNPEMQNLVRLHYLFGHYI